MTREVIWIEPEDDLALAWALMNKLGFRHLPVMQDRRLVGILSDRDVLAFANVRNGILDVPPTPVAEAMSRDVLTCSPEESIARIAARMLESKIDSIPIVAGGGNLVGLVTSSDLIQLLVDREDVAADALPFTFEVRNAGLRSAAG